MLLLATFVDHSLWENSAKLHDELKLLLFIVAREKRFPGVQLGEDAAKRPDVNFFAVLDAQNDLWGSVIPRLHIGVHLLVSEAARAEVDDLQLRSGWVDTEDILRLEIAMDHVALFEEYERLEQLGSI